ncbi:MAG: potassium channel family protein [Gammaproteobacteria bacterium]
MVRRHFMHVRPGHFTLLLASLLVLLVVGAFLAEDAHGRMITNVLLGFTLILSIYPVSRHRAFVFIGSTVAALTFIALWVSEFTGSTNVQLLALGGGFVFYLHAAIVILTSILRTTHISTDELAGAVSAYLLLGISGAFIFAFLEVYHPGSVVGGMAGGAALPAIGVDLQAFFYFSFTCLTTLGFGDLVPATAPARVFAYLEAVLGQVYLTVLVARLVGLHLSHAHANPD